MPFYEYQCRHCGHHTEVLQKVSDGPLRKCPACGRNGLTKLISAPIFRLKGGGWYETDFKGEQDRKRNLAGDEPPAEKKGEGDKPPAKSETKSEAPAAKPAGRDKPAAKPKRKPSGKPAAKSVRKTPAKKRR